MNISRLIILIVCLIMVCASARANDFTINSKVYFGGINTPSECTNIDDIMKTPIYCESELPQRSEAKSVKTPEADQEISLVSDSMNSFIKASSRL